MNEERSRKLVKIASLAEAYIRDGYNPIRNQLDKAVHDPVIQVMIQDLRREEELAIEASLGGAEDEPVQR